MPDNPLLVAALAYAAKGWKVLPLHTPVKSGCSCGKEDCKGKHPRTAHGVKDSTNDASKIKAWWVTWPEANVGLATGDASGGALVLDFDDAELYPQWCEKLNGLSDKLVVQQTGRGFQVILRCDQPGVNQKLARDENGETLLETRATGGYIMAAPSLHPNGKTYKMLQGTFTAVPRLKPTEVEELLSAAKSFDKTITPDPWKIYTLADALAERPPLEWAVNGLLPMQSLSIVYAAPGALKSFLLADLSMCCALGRPWLEMTDGKSKFTCPGAPAMWLDFDNGRRRTHNRFEALAHAYSATDETPLFYVSMPMPTLDAGNAELMFDLASRISDRGIKLCVIDNLGLISGATEENSAYMTAIMGGLRWLAEFTGAAIVVIHHQRKSGTMKSGREGDTLRGHSSIEAALDLSLLVLREDGTGNLTVKATKTRDIDIDTFGAMFTYEHKPGTKELATARFFGMPVVSHADRAMDALKERLTAILSNGPMGTRQILAAAGGNGSKVLTALSDLHAEHIVKLELGRNNSKTYSLAGNTGPKKD